MHAHNYVATVQNKWKSTTAWRPRLHHALGLEKHVVRLSSHVLQGGG